jgi:hypothetical protein
MTINTYTQGSVEPKCIYLTTTSATDFLIPPSKTKYVVHNLIVCNKTGSGTTITITLTDGTTTWALYSVLSVGANTTVSIDLHGLPVPNGWKIRLTAAAGNALDVTAAISTFSASTNGPQQ